ncbi:MAG: TROVE domain-containing protein [Synergistaceae bacterium]|nr:TROVE domain-containing protein [Synergistaceae bacterium]
MTYQGRKFTEQTRLMQKRNVIDEDMLAKHHRRGRGGQGYRRWNRLYMKRRMWAAEADRQAKYDLFALCDEIDSTASLYDAWSPEEAERLRKLSAVVREMSGSSPRSSEIERMLADRRKFRLGDAKDYLYVYYPEAEMPAIPAVKPAILEVVSAEVKTLGEKIREKGLTFTGGASYSVSPLDTLKMISASSIFGEPQYYRNGESAKATCLDGVYGIEQDFVKYSLRAMDPFEGMTTSQVMEKAIDDALSADFGAVLDWAVELRERYMMRLNPQVIMVRASKHPGREAFTKANPGKFAEIAQKVMTRGDDVINQIQYWLYSKGSKRGIPGILKRSWAKRISTMNAYSMSKYGHAGIGLVDAVRISHAKGALVDQLMRKGRVSMPEGQDTWERLRSSGKSWSEILGTIRLPHMALLRNLRGIFSEIEDAETRSQILAQLKAGVLKGKQFPFRYLAAWYAVQEVKAEWTGHVQKALEECMNIACANLPKLPGRNAFLSDNSGSAWSAFTSEYGSINIADIDNLSSVIGAMRSDEGVVFPFAHKVAAIPVDRSRGILEQARHMGKVGVTLGGASDGAWPFFRDAILQNQHWDNIFIYSDMQLGHDWMYMWRDYGPEAEACGFYREGSAFRGVFDLNAILSVYRRMVNPKVNVYSIQTAGYANTVVPEYGYRVAVLYGWTGKELIFADAMRRIWDEIEGRSREED